MNAKTTKAKLITRSQMIAAIEKRLPDRRPTGNSFAERGAQTQWDRATKLLRRLSTGGKPTTAEVVAYFGAGARFAE